MGMFDFMNKGKTDKKDEGLEPKMKCRNCSNLFIPELKGNNQYSNSREFCNPACLVDYLLTREVILSKDMMFLTERFDEISNIQSSLVKKFNSLDDRLSKVVSYLIRQRKKSVRR